MQFLTATFWGWINGFAIGAIVGAIWSRHFIFEILGIYRGKEVKRGILGNALSRSDREAPSEGANR